MAKARNTASRKMITGLTQMFLGSSASLWTSLILLGVAIVLELVVLNILRVKLGKALEHVLVEMELELGIDIVECFFQHGTVSLRTLNFL